MRQDDAQTQSPESYGGKIAEQLEVAKRALAYNTRFTQPVVSEDLAARFDEASRAAGVRK